MMVTGPHPHLQCEVVGYYAVCISMLVDQVFCKFQATKNLQAGKHSHIQNGYLSQ